FLAADAPDVFARFAQRAVTELGDLCQDWVTINEPNVYCSMGYQFGEFPPGHTGQFRPAVAVLANMTRAHARAYRAIHGVQQAARVGWAQHYLVFQPANNRSAPDALLCRVFDKLFNESFIRIMAEGYPGLWLRALTGDVSEAAHTSDFAGLNVYNRAHVAFDLQRRNSLFADIFIPEDVPQGDPRTERPYGEAYPEAM